MCENVHFCLNIIEDGFEFLVVIVLGGGLKTTMRYTDVLCDKVELQRR